MRRLVLRRSAIVQITRLALGLFFFGASVVLYFELLASPKLQQQDEAILLALESLRTPMLNTIMLAVTALGTFAILTVFCLFGLLTLMTLRKRWEALHLLLASLGAAVLSSLMKWLIARPRPIVAHPLVVEFSSSYPSGHSLGTTAVIMTLALLVVEQKISWKLRGLVLGFATALVLAVGFSRLYLGVHYPSDVLGGICAGLGWALFMQAVFMRHSPISKNAPKLANPQ